jgi:hypothetical protein
VSNNGDGLQQSIAAYDSWAKTTNRTKRTEPGRKAFYQSILDAHDGDEKRAQAAYRAHFRRMALKSRNVRRRKAKAGE